MREGCEGRAKEGEVRRSVLDMKCWLKLSMVISAKTSCLIQSRHDWRFMLVSHATPFERSHLCFHFLRSGRNKLQPAYGRVLFVTPSDLI